MLDLISKVRWIECPSHNNIKRCWILYPRSDGSSVHPTTISKDVGSNIQRLMECPFKHTKLMIEIQNWRVLQNWEGSVFRSVFRVRFLEISRSLRKGYEQENGLGDWRENLHLFKDKLMKLHDGRSSHIWIAGGGHKNKSNQDKCPDNTKRKSEYVPTSWY